jgi:replicative DNA helicase
MRSVPNTHNRAVATAETHVPPQNLEAEASVLGAMMVSEGAIAPVILDVRLHDEDFYRERHRIVFRAVTGLYEQGEPVDALTVSEFLAQRGELTEAGGKESVSELASTVPVPGNARHYAQIVKQNALLRRLLATSQRIQKSVHDREGEPDQLVERAESLLFKVAHEERASDFRRVAEVLGDEIDRLEQLAKGDQTITGTPSGFRDLDAKLGGFQPGNLIVIAARPSLGKSALVCNIAENVASKYGKPVAFFSLEMSEAELAHRFISCRSRIPNDKLRKGNVASRDWPRVVRACNELEKVPLWLDDSSDLSLLELRAKARRLAASEGGLGLVIVDYLQLMRAEDPRSNRVEQVGQFSRGMKILARELNVPVIGISQLSRAPEQRPGGKPMLSDLRESGCLTGDSRVFLPDEGTYLPISELNGRSGFNVLAVDPETWKLEPRPVTRAFSTGRKAVLRLQTGLGREIRATGNHKFLTLDGWRRLDELSPGARIALPRQLGNPRDQSRVTPDELALLGHLIGDGCTLPSHALQYTTNDPLLAKHVVRLAKSVFGDSVRPRISRERDRKRGREWLQVYLPPAYRLTHGVRNPIAEWLEGFGAFGLRSHEKRVPNVVFEQNEAGIEVFLRHLWATDGCVWLGRSKNGKAVPAVYYATSSPTLARDVQSLLLRVGINARRRVYSQKGKGRPQHHVTVSGGADLAAFLDRVGGLGEAKKEHASAMRQAIAAVQPNTNRDVIPKEAWSSIVKPSRVAAGVTEREFQASIGTRYCGTTLYKSAISRERASRVAEALHATELRRLAESDVYWDRIESIEPDGEEEVYDLTVEGLHNFVAEDIVVHNSIEQDSDVVVFIYRASKYDEDADPSEADLIVAKHRNGPTGDVPVVFLEQYPRFVDRAGGSAPAVEQKAGEGPPLIDLADDLPGDDLAEEA